MKSQPSGSVSRRQFIASGTGALAASLLPASAASAESRRVWGIAELWEWLYARQQTTGHDSADCLQAHLDHGIRHVMWALGRSTLDYHSELPTSTLYAGDTRPETKVIAEPKSVNGKPPHPARKVVKRAHGAPNQPAFSSPAR